MFRQSLNFQFHLSFPFLCYFPKIVEEVQKFYSTSIADVSDSNATAIASIYHNVVSRGSAGPSALCDWCKSGNC